MTSSGTSTNTTGRRFLEALRELESAKGTEAMAGLFAPDARLVLTTTNRAYTGREGAREFWRQYLAMFEHVHTAVEEWVEAAGRATFRWTKTGLISRLAPQAVYRGVTVIHYGDDGLIRHLRTEYEANPRHARPSSDALAHL